MRAHLKAKHDIDLSVIKISAEKTKKLPKNDLQSRKRFPFSLNYHFSFTLDEYNSVQNRRYMNINVHVEDRHWNLGSVRTFGSMPAEKAVAVVKKKLDEFGIDLDSDVVAATTDGASVMVKFGKSILSIPQLCLAHGIHLAICGVLYKINKDMEPIADDITIGDDTLSDGELSNDDDNDDGSLQVRMICRGN